MRRAFVPVVCLAALLAWPSGARAYCTSTTCPGQDRCDDGSGSADCLPLWWPTGCVGFSVAADGSIATSADTTELIAELAFARWMQADCGGATPGVHVWNMGQVGCTAAEYNKDAGNANVIAFRDRGWPHPNDAHNVALTTTTFDPDTGELLDADIELNSSAFEFTVDDLATEYDLYSVLTHEAGHFLGLGHSATADATMTASYVAGTIDLRTLAEDDALGVCSLYPPNPDVDGSCNPIPKHGFSPECRDDQTEGSCAYAPKSDPREGVAALAIALCALAIRRRSAPTHRAERLAGADVTIRTERRRR